MLPYKTPEEAIEAAMKAVVDGYVEFEGMNCNDYLDLDAEECEGWDGVDRRCECGNRRVYWDASGNPEAGFVAYAVAN